MLKKYANDAVLAMTPALNSSPTLGRIVVLGTGGTIAGTAADAGDNIGYTAAQVGVGQLLDAIPALRECGYEIVAEQVAQVDSKDMAFAIWQKLAARVAYWIGQAGVSGVVITHGTDTLEETAFFLQAVLNPAKPVVITCAMRPASSIAPDGPQNVLDAVAVAGLAGARGVVAVCAGAVHSAFDVQKSHTYRLDAFSSGDAGPIGYVEEGRVRLLRGWPDAAAPVFPATSANPQGAPALASAAADRVLPGPSIIDSADWPQVEIVLSHAGAGDGLVRSLVAQGVQGIVVGTTGNGTVHFALEAGLLHAMAQGVRVVRATRCANGQILATRGSVMPDAAALSPVKARIALMLTLLGETG